MVLHVMPDASLTHQGPEFVAFVVDESDEQDQ